MKSSLTVAESIPEMDRTYRTFVNCYMSYMSKTGENYKNYNETFGLLNLSVCLRFLEHQLSTFSECKLQK